MTKPLAHVIGRWQRYTPVRVPAQAFLERCEQEIEALAVAHLHMSRIVVNESLPIVGARREMLRVRDAGGEFVYDISIMPFSVGTVIASVVGVDHGPIFAVLLERPKLGNWLLSVLKPRTYVYEWRIKAFRDLVAGVVEKIADDMTASAGEPLSEPQRRPFLDLFNDGDP